MNVQTTAERGYMQHAASTHSERRIEYEVMARVTHRLREAARRAKRNYPAYVEALDDNRKLWQVFAVDVLDKDNELPDELRARIFYLAEFTAAHTTKILREKASVVPLLEINVAILRGLNAKGARK